MQFRTHQQIREDFLQFFAEREHKRLPSASLLLKGEKDLFFTNAGMNQFKDIFLGLKDSPTKRAVNIQKCLRISGKHNDLDAVGHDAYHHTFFEMMGSWSFNDYGREEAIRWAWELLTKVWELPKEKLYATVYRDDSETKELWETETDIAHSHILTFDEKDNFWEMGQTGPCGPCTEIHMDLGEAIDPSKDAWVNSGSPRYIELWNLVFIEHRRDDTGKLRSLDGFYVDTGMGLERIVRVLQERNSNYEIDLFQSLIGEVKAMIPVSKRSDSEEVTVALRVISDHVRAVGMAIADGSEPSHEGAGYVIRCLIRRAMNYASSSLGIKDFFLGKLYQILEKEMGGIYNNLHRERERTLKILDKEETLFRETLDEGMLHFKRFLAEVKTQGKKQFPGEYAFKLYETYGFPLDLTRLLLRENSLHTDEAVFDQLMEEHRRISRRKENFPMEKEAEVLLRDYDSSSGPVVDKFFFNDEGFHPIPPSIIHDTSIKEGKAKEALIMLTEETCLRVAGGGQVYDKGFFLNNIDLYSEEVKEIINKAIQTIRKHDPNRIKEDLSDKNQFHKLNIIAQYCLDEDDFSPLMAFKKISKAGLHITTTYQKDRFQFYYGELLWGKIEKGTESYSVPPPNYSYIFRHAGRRQKIRMNHSATHLLHQALCDVLGDGVKQEGSRITPEELRFDFSHPQALTQEELQKVESHVQDKIQRDLPVTAENMSLDKAKSLKAKAFFTDKYGDTVRVVTIKDKDNAEKNSVELCGGTHVANTGKIKAFKIIQEKSSSAGVRRIIALTGQYAQEYQASKEKSSKEKSSTQGKPSSQEAKLWKSSLDQTIREQVDTLHAKRIEGRKNHVQLYYLDMEGKAKSDQNKRLTDALRAALDRLRVHHKKSVIFFVTHTPSEDKAAASCHVQFLCGMGEFLQNTLHAGNLVRDCAAAFGGGGGGRSDFAQAGIKYFPADQLKDIRSHVVDLLKKAL